MGKYIKTFVILFFLLALCSCIQDSKKGGPPPFGKSDIPPITTPEPNDPTFVVKPSQVVGNWIGECITVNEKLSLRPQITFQAESNWIQTESYFWNETCENLEYKYVYHYQSNFTDLSEMNSQKFELKLKKVEIVAVSVALVDFANSYIACGYENWGIGSVRDATGKNCEFFGQMPALNSMAYDIISVSEDSLFLGDQSGYDRKTEVTRPVFFSPHPYNKITP